eukprot:2895377-Amphidinium_carterae.1
MQQHNDSMLSWMIRRMNIRWHALQIVATTVQVGQTISTAPPSCLLKLPRLSCASLWRATSQARGHFYTV